MFDDDLWDKLDLLDLARWRPPEVGSADVQIVTLGGGVVSEFCLPWAATAAATKEKVHEKLGQHPSEQRLMLGVQTFEGATRLFEAAAGLGSRGGSSVQITLVHVPAPTRVALIGGRDGGLCLWDVEGRRALRSLRSHRAGVSCASLDWASRRALTGSQDGTLRVWDLENGEARHVLGGHSGGVTCASVHWGAAPRALTGGVDGALRLWDLTAGELLQQLISAHAGDVLCVEYDAASQRAVSGGLDNALKMWDLVAEEVIQERQGHTPVHCVAVDFSKQQAIAGSFAVLQTWELSTWFGFCWGELTGHSGLVTCVAAHGPTQTTVSGSTDATLRIWQPGMKPVVLVGHNMPVNCLAADWAANLLVSGSEDGTVRIWDLERREAAGLLDAQFHGAVLCVAVSSSKG